MTSTESKALEFVLKHLQVSADSQVSRRASYYLDSLEQERLASSAPQADAQTVESFSGSLDTSVEDED